MVGVILRDAPRAVKLLGEQHAHHAVRQREARHAQQQLGARLERRGEPVGAADHERDVAAVLLPRGQRLRELHRGPVAAALVERDDARVLRQRGFDPLLLGGHHAVGRARARAQLGLHFTQLDAQLGRHPLRVLVEAGRDPAGHLVADRDDVQFHDGERDESDNNEGDETAARAQRRRAAVALRAGRAAGVSCSSDSSSSAPSAARAPRACAAGPPSFIRTGLSPQISSRL
ncbi:hypothetical protein BURPS1710b_1380 [Burkholderia pseudomallei 1710b]|uniref:Uncharacterized protein n=1 Tax=Burkholderia pseudomallei (strain 1710b) TaxID=320372 RepID=Q3JUG3_BURP1|nr:hypothetical protein BURPS1710b_1380 [Burkholderia pseudomallei 1710b]